MADLRPFMQACQRTLDTDADLFQLAAMGVWSPSMARWLEENTINLSPNPKDWDPAFRELWSTILTNRLRDL